MKAGESEKGKRERPWIVNAQMSWIACVDHTIMFISLLYVILLEINGFSPGVSSLATHLRSCERGAKQYFFFIIVVVTPRTVLSYVTIDNGKQYDGLKTASLSDFWQNVQLIALFMDQYLVVPVTVD